LRELSFTAVGRCVFVAAGPGLQNKLRPGVAMVLVRCCPMRSAAGGRGGGAAPYRWPPRPGRGGVRCTGWLSASLQPDPEEFVMPGGRPRRG